MMPSKKKKYNARFPAGRIKKIMQMDDDVGKIAHAVPVVISRSVELFVNSLLNHTADITREKNAKTVSLSHTKHCILNVQKFEFLKDLVKNIADVGPEEDKKSSKASSSSPERLTEGVPERSRKRNASDSHSNEPTSRNTSKKRHSHSESDKNPLRENLSTSIPSQSNDWDTYDSHNFNKSDLSRLSETSSCDLVIDESRDT
ncbi:dr1-associated corepressor [Planococcus citri]|uniref:dr1-associated corepressor n=1 Tax=Planococcus citri TaxID=170843 RepID=UPI0031F84359